MGKIGDLRSKEIKFEWLIKDFLQHSYQFYDSPQFSLCGETWNISIFPNTDKDDGTSGFIDLCIESMTLNKPITVNYSFHLKTVDGKVDPYTGCTGTEVFIGALPDCIECNKLISRSELLERESELLPSGILTIICTLKESNTVRVDEKDGVDQFTQTEETIGVWKLQEYFKKILDNGNFSDVVLKVEDQEFKSHGNVLARSPVFQAMLTHETKEKSTGIVNIKDVDAKTFSNFLSYLYTGSENIITSENVVNLFTAADKYQVDELKESCRDYMLKNINVDNFCEILSLSLVHIEKDLVDACSLFFIENSLAVVRTSKWIEFAAKNPVASTELYIKQLENNMKNKLKTECKV